MTAGRLGGLLGLNSAGTTAVVDRLERLGHARRVRDARDRRRVLVEVEKRAVELGQAFFGPLHRAGPWNCSGGTTSANWPRSGASSRAYGRRRRAPGDRGRTGWATVTAPAGIR